jgi:transposase
MSTKPYSEDLRKRVIEYIKEGGNYKEASKIYKVSVSAIGRWYRRYKSEGIYQARKRLGAKIKIDLARLENSVQINPDVKLKELSKEFKVSTFTVSHWLRRLGFSYKKKPLPTWSQVKKKERSI